MPTKVVITAPNAKKQQKKLVVKQDFLELIDTIGDKRKVATKKSENKK